MDKLINEIRGKDFKLSYLLEKVETFFKISKDLKNNIEPMLKEKYIQNSKENKELIEEGFIYILGRYYYEVGMEFDEFKRLLIDENFNKKEKEIHELYISISRDIFEMERTKYLYQAYNIVLKEKLDMFNYNYNN